MVVDQSEYRKTAIPLIRSMTRGRSSTEEERLEILTLDTEGKGIRYITRWYCAQLQKRSAKRKFSLRKMKLMLHKPREK